MRCEKNHIIVDDSVEVIIDGAKIMCSQAQEPGASPRYVFLRIPDGHGSLENGHLCAHDQDCAPITNIPAFPACFSPYYKSLLDYLGAWTSGKHEYQEAVKAYTDGHYYRPCLLSLLNRWVGADDKSVVQEYLDVSFDFGFDAVKGQIELYCREIEQWAMLLYSLRDSLVSNYLAGSADKLNEVAKDYNIVLGYVKEIQGITKKIADSYTIYDFSVESIGLEHAKAQADEWYHNLNSLLSAVQNAFYRMNHTEQGYRKESGMEAVEGFSALRPIYEEIRDWLKDKIKEVERLHEKISTFNPEPHHLLTMDSYLICRGGGILSFYTSGQEYAEYFAKLHQIILDFVQTFIDDCDDRLKTNRRFAANALPPELDEEGYSYDKAIKALRIYKKLLSDLEGTEPITMNLPIYLELISHSYRVEQLKKMMALVSVAVTWLGSPGMACLWGGLQIGIAVGSGDLFSGVSAGISAEDDINPMLRVAQPEIVQYNNIFGTMTAMVDFFTKSEDVWIEGLKISVFCTNTEELNGQLNEKEKFYAVPKGECDFLHTAYCELTQDMRIKQECVCKVKTRRDYEVDVGGIWDITPAAKLLLREHVGEYREEDIDSGGGISHLFNPASNLR